MLLQFNTVHDNLYYVKYEFRKNGSNTTPEAG